MKKILLLFLLLPILSQAQQTHTVGPKETLFSIGRDYNVHPRELAEYNNIPFETGLTLGQVLKIPVKKSMAPLKPDATNPAAANSTENKIPIFHKVGKKENLFQISQRYDKVPIDDLKKWNNLGSDALNEGMDLIVGYKQANGTSAAKTDQVKSIVQQAPAAQKNMVLPSTASNSVIASDTGRVNNFPTPQVKRVIVKTNRKDFKGGFFKTTYDTQGNADKQEEGLAGIFKSTSGWEDGKYYCLHNTAKAGSIIKITNKNNQKSIYAKVLDVIPDLKQNEGLVVRISNSAADELGVDEGDFAVTLQF